MPPKGLIVDDVALNRNLLRNLLERDYEILEAEDGSKALAILREHGDSIAFVLLDLMMPVMDGYQVLEQMRVDAKLAAIPVIVETANASEDHELRALSLGAADFIAKPYNPAVVLKRIDNAVRLREAAAEASAAARDDLTGLYSRKAFFAKVEKLVAMQAPGYYVMACFDIDNFKVINDQYGTQKGDEVLRFMGETFERGFAPHGGVCCRVMADNFAVLYPAACIGSEEIEQIRREAGNAGGLVSPVSFSVGRYIVEDLSLSASAMFDRATLAEASIKGRYDVHIAQYDKAMRDKLIRSQQLTSEMGDALERRQFEVWFQPQYNHSTGALIGSEALVRWRHPKKGLVPPDEFIPVFEKNGFIYALDQYVWEETCRYLRKWMDEERNPLPVSVNISRYDVFMPGLIERITGLMEAYDVPVDLLRLEITESAFAESAEQIIAVVKRLIGLGFTVEIDDFGSGYSSLNTLKDVPAQVLKLDMRFLEHHNNSERGGNILESVVRMAKWLDMSVIAEGVETMEQANYLQSIGCNYVQGYLYARPMPARDYEALCRGIGKEQRLLAMQAVENLNNNAFWDPDSMDTLIFNSYVGGACIFEDRNGEVELLRANEKYARVLGGDSHLSMEEALKLSWQDHLDEKDRNAIHDALRRALETGDEFTGEYVFLDLPGCAHETYLRATMRVIATAGDRFLVYCTNENITAQRKAEQKQREAEQKRLEASERAQAIMDDAGSGITAGIPRDGNVAFLFSNDQYYEILGYTREQYAAEVHNIFDLIDRCDRDYVRQITAEAYRTGRSTSLEYRVNRRDGSMHWVRAILSVTHFTGVLEPVQLCVFTDVTAEKQVEQSLRQTDEQLRFLNETAHELLKQPDSNKGIDATLLKLLHYFDGDRAYVFEFDYDRTVANNTYEVCAGSVVAEKGNLQSVPMEIMSFWLDAFGRESYIDIADVDALCDDRMAERRALAAQGIRSLVAVPLRRDGDLIGFLGIDNPRQQDLRVNRLVAIGDYIAVMLTRRDLNVKINSDNMALQSLMNDTPGGFVCMRVNPNGSIVPVYFNNGFCKLVGMDRPALMDMYEKDAYAGVHPDDVGVVSDAVRLMLKNGEAHSARYRLLHGGGGYVPLMFFGRSIRGASGETFLNIYYTDLMERDKTDGITKETSAPRRDGDRPI